MEPHRFVPVSVYFPPDECAYLPPGDIQCGEPADAAVHRVEIPTGETS